MTFNRENVLPLIIPFRRMLKSAANQQKKVSYLELVTIFAKLIRPKLPACTGSIRTVKASATTQSLSSVTWQQVLNTNIPLKKKNNRKLILDGFHGSTAILHDSESRISVSHCSDPGCYSRLIKYSATSGQMSALAELSDECHQSIMVLKYHWYSFRRKWLINFWMQYDCTSAPLKIYGIMFSWWNDNDGNPHYFWSGGNNNVHTCQCGIERNCVEDLAVCNCDSCLPTPLSDIGNDHG